MPVFPAQGLHPVAPPGAPPGLPVVHPRRVPLESEARPSLVGVELEDLLRLPSPERHKDRAWELHQGVAHLWAAHPWALPWEDHQWHQDQER